MTTTRPARAGELHVVPALAFPPDARLPVFPTLLVALDPSFLLRVRRPLAIVETTGVVTSEGAAAP